MSGTAAKPAAKKAPNWSDEEKEALTKAWAIGGAKAAVEACPGRSADTCRRMAGELGVRVGKGVRQEIARINRSRAGRMGADEIIELRRKGASVGEIATAGGLSLDKVHKALEGQPRHIRFRGESVREVEA